MIVSNCKASYSNSPGQVWALVTDLKNYGWRSDLGRIEVVEPGRVFVEYTGDGFPTTFTITCFKPFEQYEFTLKNENMQGTWTGLFRETAEGTEVDFTESVTVKKPLMKLFAKGYLNRQQKRYIEDLRRALQA